MRRLFIFAIITAILIFTSTPSHAFWWMGYHKPAFQGKVIDAETKKPIEGAVVVVTYSKETMSVPEHYSSIIEVKEALTDKSGEFYIPSYTTIIQPLSAEDAVSFIIFKPGYGSFPNRRIYPPMRLSLLALEDFFSGKVGTEGEVAWDFEREKVTFGIVELPKLKTREERRLEMPSPVGEFSDRKKQKQFIRLLNEENKNLGLTGEYNYE